MGEPQRAEEPDDVACPVRRCRAVADDRLEYNGILIFRVCGGHKAEIEADNWDDWVFDMRVNNKWTLHKRDGSEREL